MRNAPTPRWRDNRPAIAARVAHAQIYLPQAARWSAGIFASASSVQFLLFEGMTWSLICICFCAGIAWEPEVMESALCVAGGVGCAGVSAAFAETTVIINTDPANANNLLIDCPFKVGTAPRRACIITARRASVYIDFGQVREG